MPRESDRYRDSDRDSRGGDREGRARQERQRERERSRSPRRAEEKRQSRSEAGESSSRRRHRSRSVSSDRSASSSDGQIDSKRKRSKHSGETREERKERKEAKRAKRERKEAKVRDAGHVTMRRRRTNHLACNLESQTKSKARRHWRRVRQVRHSDRSRASFSALTMSDMLTTPCSIYTKDAEFRCWLVEEKMLNPETLSQSKTKDLFRQFAEECVL